MTTQNSYVKLVHFYTIFNSLHFNRAQKYIGIFDENKEEAKNPIDSLDDIFKFEEQLKKTALSYS